MSTNIITENLRKQLISLQVSNIKIENIIQNVSFKDNKVGIILDNNKIKHLDKVKIAHLEEVIKLNIQKTLPQAYIYIIKHDQKESSLNHLSNQEKKEISKIRMENIKHIISIVSCKGGVGKSTTIINIANILSQKGFSVAILDADIYGPSIPTMLGAKTKLKMQDGKIVPIIRHNIKAVSMGYIVEEGRAAIWRGPILTKTLKNLFLNTTWGQIDYLLIDTPPGTGDVHLSIAENFIIDGAIIVTTPQKIATEENERMVDMLDKLDIKILGVIENMSYLEINNHKKYIFGFEGGKRLSEKYNITFLGEIKIKEQMTELLDKGKIDELDTKTIEDYYIICKKIITYFELNNKN